jgi:hypothetical protein
MKKFLSIMTLTLCLSLADGQTGNVKLIVKDSTKYSARFLKEVRKTGLKFTLRDSIIAVDGQGSGIFPGVLPLNKKKTLVGVTKDKNKSYIMTVTRINYSTIKYYIQIKHDSIPLLKKFGTADLNTMFFLGEGTDNDDETDMAYGITEYYDNPDSDSLFLDIRIGTSEKGSLIGNFTSLSLGDSPTLREKIK